MKAKIPLEDLINDDPQKDTLIHLFEEDASNLRKWSHQVQSALENWCSAQTVLMKAMSNLADVVGSYGNQKFPLDETLYDIPSVTDRIAQTLSELMGCMEILKDQIDSCVLYPVRKITKELDHIIVNIKPNFDESVANLKECEERFARANRREQPRKLIELSNQLNGSRLDYHKKAIEYCARMNSLQGIRYTQLIEPLIAMLCTYRSYFAIGHDSLRKEYFTEFLSTCQQQMQSINEDTEVERKESLLLMETLSKKCDEVCDADYSSLAINECESSQEIQKQGYLRIKVKSGLFSANNWEKYFVFTQGTCLMWQKECELAASVMLDLVSIPGASAHAAGGDVDRRFVFIFTEPSNKGKRWLLQAKSSNDMREWVDVINNLCGFHKKCGDEFDDLASAQFAELAEEGIFTGLSTDNDFSLKLSMSNEQPIQFDLFAEEKSLSGINSLTTEGNDVSMFDVGFLGSLVIENDRCKESMAHLAIQKVLNARAIHCICESSACRMLISRAVKKLVLVDHEHESNVKATYDFADLIFWAAYSDDSIFAILSRIRAENESSSEYKNCKCTVLTSGIESSGIDICAELTIAVCESSSASNDDEKRSLASLQADSTIEAEATSMNVIDE